MAVISKRATCTNSNGDLYYCNRWGDWGRWVFLAIIIAGAFIIFLAFACISARRRRRQGSQPFYGTGWAAQGPPFHNNQYPYPQQPYDHQKYPNAPPPQYTPPAGFYAPQQPEQPTYFGGQQGGYELQPPQNAYHAGDNVYPPPPGPPPAK